MNCKFLSNGLAIQYHNFVKPCCTWQADDQWIADHALDKVNLVTWHQHADLVTAREQLANNIWPKNCRDCELVESQGRQDSIRLNGESAYSQFNENELTLEIRPGSVCNFACQTCWAPASTRVEQFYRQAGIINIYSDITKNKFDNYDFLLPVANKLKSIIVLGGEPFYDPACLQFLQWASENTQAEITAFTNGSVVNIDLLQSFDRKFTLVFSLDAVGTAAEYIRFGTDWPKVWANYQRVKLLPNVATRINITTSPYNYFYFSDVLDLVLDDWPEVISFGPTMEEHFSEHIVPIKLREKIIGKLESTIDKLQQATIEVNQKVNAVNSIQAIIKNLTELPYSPTLHNQFIEFVGKMDLVKHANFADYCPDIVELLTVEGS